MVGRFVTRGLVFSIIVAGALLMLASMDRDETTRRTTGRLMAAACNGDVAAATAEWERSASRLDAAGRRAALATTLHTGATLGHPEIVRLALRWGADPNAATERGSTALMMAATAPRGSEIVQLLLDAGARPDACDELDNTALTAAAIDGNAAVVDLLLRAGSDRGHANQFGRTAASMARLAGHDELARSLDDAADPSARNRSSRAGSLATNQPTFAK